MLQQDEGISLFDSLFRVLFLRSYNETRNTYMATNLDSKVFTVNTFQDAVNCPVALCYSLYTSVFDSVMQNSF